MLADIIELALDVVGELTEAAFSSGTGGGLDAKDTDCMVLESQPETVVE